MQKIWKDLKIVCRHCGEPLQGRFADVPGVFVAPGLEPMEFRHANGDVECVQINRAEPCGMERARENMRRAYGES